MNTQQKKLHQLFFPIFFELLFVMLTGAVDTLMLSSVGDQAVGAVGTANTYIGLFIMMFSIISSGVMAVMTQYIGAGRPGVARQAMTLGLVFNMTLGAVITLALTCGAELILNTVGIAPQLMDDAKTYMQVVGLFCLCNAVYPIFSGFLRSFGHATPTLLATVCANLVNVGLNAIFLYGFHWGVWGVALATGISRLVNLLWLIIATSRRIHVSKDTNPLPARFLLGQIIRVGFPAAMESCLYCMAITMMTRFLNQMDETGMQASARAYTVQISNFSYTASGALAQANAILAGWRIGAGKLDECHRGTRKAGLLAVLLGAGTAAIFALVGTPLVGLFTDDPEMVRLVSNLLCINIALEVGRALNLVYGSALKASGDAVFPMVIAVVFVFLCAAGGTWFFGIHLGWLAVGAYIALALDECVRAVGMVLRWYSGKWKEHRIVNN